MPSFNSIISALAFIGLSIAAPTTPNPKRTFTIPQKIVNEGWLPHPAHLVVKTHYKYGAQPSAKVLAAAAAANGTVVAAPTDKYDSSYLSPVNVGGKVLNLDFDTGSSDLWVFSSLQPSAQTSGHNAYTVNPSKQISGATWRISYGDGSGASGNVYRDTVNIGGVTFSSQAVEAATSVSAQFVQDKSTDGLVGLAFSSINTVTPTKQKTFLDNVSPSLASPIVVANLKYHASGEYDFGFTSPSKYTGSISYTNVDSSQGFWTITVSSYGVGNTVRRSSIKAIADTGTTLIYLPPAVLSAYYSQVNGAQNSDTYGGYVFPCSASLPNLLIRIGSYNAIVPGKYINYAPVANNSPTCFGGIQDSSDIGISILGDVFLKSQYVVFDNSATPRLGLAAKPT